VSAAASGVLDPEQQARLALDEVIRILNAERGFLFSGAANGELTLTAGRSADGQDIAEVSDYSRGVVERVRTTCQPLVLSGSHDSDVIVSDSICPSKTGRDQAAAERAAGFGSARAR